MNCVSSTADAYRDVQYIADTPPRAATRAPSPHLHPPTPLREDQRAATRAPSPHLHPPTPLQEDQYATIPVVAVKPAFQQADEEELHTSFEQAISDRVLAVNRQLSRMSGPITDAGYGCVQPHTDELIQQDIPAMTMPLPAVANPSGHVDMWKQIVLMVCLCLMLVLLGFDLMGVLIVYGGR